MLPKFLIYVDYLSNSSISSEYIEIPAKKLEDAILAAENIFDSGKHYLVSVMAKTSPVMKQNDIKAVEYTAVMNRRFGGWHLCGDDCGEYTHKTSRCWFCSGRNCSSVPWYDEL